MTIDELLNVFREHLYLPDPAPVEVVVGAMVANLLRGDPVWLLLVGPPASGKTEILSSLCQVPDVYETSSLTEPGLLSGSSARTEGSTGGLLAEMGSFGHIICKDFTSILSQSSDTRTSLLAALREIYDGKWIRRLGTGGGKAYGWKGKAALLAGVTETIDRHSAVIGAMGERFVLYRMPELSDEGRLDQGRAAMANAGRQELVRQELANAMRKFFAGLQIPQEPSLLSKEEGERLILLSDLATRCRSTVERDGRDREIELVPQPEALGRMQAVFTQIVRGMRVAGIADEEIERLTRALALDSIPKVRRNILEFLAGQARFVNFTAAELGDRVGLPTATVNRALHELLAHAVIERHSDNPNRWGASEWLRERWQSLDLCSAEG
ncbi:MAG: hypothetical protein ABSF84_00635 [Acidimicrobiales bacterium]|jgi:hypothetical protein